MSQTSKIAGPLFIICILASVAGFGYFQFVYMPEVNKEVIVPEEWLNPPEKTIIDILLGSVDQDQEENFLPNAVSVTLGKNNLVTWLNLDGVIHTVTAEIGKEFIKLTGNANYIDPEGGEFSFLFTESGEYTYYCSPHPWMRGTIIVSEPESELESEPEA